jgi:hypothetical protein
MHLPQGKGLTPHEAMDIVTGTGEPPGVLYRRGDGEVYFLGLKADRRMWKQRGFRFMGSVPAIRRRLAEARETGVRERSTAWYLLIDAEWQSRVEG